MEWSRIVKESGAWLPEEEQLACITQTTQRFLEARAGLDAVDHKQFVVRVWRAKP